VAQLGPNEERAHSQSLPFKTFKAPDKGAPLQVPLKSPHKEGYPLQSPVSSSSTSRVPNEGASPPRPPPWSLFKERDTSSTEPHLPSLKDPGRRALLQVPCAGNRAPMEGDARLQSLFLHILQGPQQGRPPSKFP